MKEDKFIKEIDKVLKKLKIMGWYEIVKIDCESKSNYEKKEVRG